MSKKKKTTFILLSLIVFFAIYYGRELYTLVIENYGVASLAYGVGVTLFTIYYSKSEKFYLFVHKYIFSIFNDYHSKWMFINSLKGVQKSESTPIKELIKRSLEKYSYKINRDLENHFEILFEEEVVIKFDIIHGDNEDYIVQYRTSKFTVPTSSYSSKISTYIALFNEISSVLKPSNSSYQISIMFDGKNPFFGFFIRYLPPEMVKDFNCRFISPKKSRSKVVASKDRITIDSASTEYLRASALDYLTLNDTIITH